MKRLSHTVIKNAIVNVLRLGAGAIVALILPPTLTHVLEQDRFAAWALLLQIAAYANFLDFGIQTAVARFVAQAMERGDEKERDGYISTAFFLLIGSGILAFGVVCAMSWLVPYMFKQAPLHLLSELREGLILLAALSALALPTSAFAGVFVGLNKNEYPAFASGVSRMIGAGLVIYAVHHTHSLIVMAGIIGGMNLVGGISQYILARRILPDMCVSMQLVTRSCFRKMTQFCAGLSVMSFAMFLVGGLDLTIVGYFQFSGVAYYSVASNMVLVVGGLAGAATSALVAPTAAIHARGEYARLGEIVLRSTRYLTQLLIIICFPLLLMGTRILTLWVGPVYANASVHIMDVLVIATAIRMLGGPYTSALIGAGEHVRVIFSPIFEGVSNLLVSVIAGYYLGPIGVAIGTLAGAVGGISLHACYNMPRIHDIRLTGSQYIVECILKPTVDLIPALVGIYMAVTESIFGVLVRLMLLAAGFIVTSLLCIRRTSSSQNI